MCSKYRMEEKREMIGKVGFMSKSYTLAQAVERLESVSINAQKTFQEIILETTYRKKAAACFQNRDQCIDELEAVGISVRVYDPVAAMLFLGRNELLKRLSTADVKGFKKTSSLNALVDWCVENASDAVISITSDVSAVVVSPEIGHIRKVYSYLCRKFDNDCYYDPDTDSMIDYPKGATFSARIGLNGEIQGSGYAFPEDEITDLLDKYGCNRCRNWTKSE